MFPIPTTRGVSQDYHSGYVMSDATSSTTAAQRVNDSIVEWRLSSSTMDHAVPELRTKTNSFSPFGGPLPKSTELVAMMKCRTSPSSSLKWRMTTTVVASVE